MSRRRGNPEPDAPPPPQQARWGLGLSAAVAIGVFIVVSLISWAVGAANLGVAIGIGQIAFGVVIVALMVWAR